MNFYQISNNNKYLILYTLIAVIVTDTLRQATDFGVALAYATYVSVILIYISIVILIIYACKSNSRNVPRRISYLICIWIFWNIFNLILGGFRAVDYWDFKAMFLASVSFTFITLAYFYGTDLSRIKIIFKFTLKYLFPFGFIFIPLSWVTHPDLYAKLMIPISVFVLFIPYLKQKHKNLIIAVAITSALVCVGFRANLLKIAIAISLLFFYGVRRYISHRVIQVAHITLFCLPIMFVTLGVLGEYNILSEIANLSDAKVYDDGAGVEVYVAGDTRTFLYVEVLSSLKETERWIIGEGASGSYRSYAFSNNITGFRRYASEVGILNIMLRYGLVGVLIYFLLLFTVSYFAINYSNNTLAKMLGLLISTRWLLSFVEEYTQYDLNFFFFWIIIGFVSNCQFRSMNETNVESFFKNITS